MSRMRWNRPRRFPPRSKRSPWRRLFDYGLTIALFALLAFLAARLDRIAMRTEQGRAVVNDGDTLTLEGERVRLRGIDAPEYTQTCRKAGGDYACGRMARKALVDLIGGRVVSCDGWQRDRYNRLLGACRAGDLDLNRSLVLAGWAVAYGNYAAEERQARAARAGIWAGDFDRPQDWRRAHGRRAEPRPDVLSYVGDWMRHLFGLR
jgi:endonuclease YncB( thermonuclease family)